MGYYIEGPARGKAELIINMHGAEEVSLDEARRIIQTPDTEQGIVCVVDNGLFEAAGFCFNEAEFEEFADPKDSRWKRWVVLPRWKAEQLSGFSHKTLEETD